MISDNVMTDGIKQHIEKQDKKIRELQALAKQLHEIACTCCLPVEQCPVFGEKK